MFQEILVEKKKKGEFWGFYTTFFSHFEFCSITVCFYNIIIYFPSLIMNTWHLSYWSTLLFSLTPDIFSSTINTSYLLKCPVSNHCQIHNQRVASLNNTIAGKKPKKLQLYPCKHSISWRAHWVCCIIQDLSFCPQIAKVFRLLLFTHKLEGVDRGCW